ncbi:MAG: glycoside hydrolase family 31 protein, partial [Oscillospiraceae bacterium]|nr:glycoside hydrolase family 31 protein [Oscillospiraceae bacterium]
DQADDPAVYRFTVRKKLSVRAYLGHVQPDSAQLYLYFRLSDDHCLLLSLTAEETGCRLLPQLTDPQPEALSRAALSLTLAEPYASASGSNVLVSLDPNPFRLALGDAENPADPALCCADLRGISLIAQPDGLITDFFIPLILSGQGFFGCGEKFDRVNQRGLQPRNLVYENYTQQGRHTYLPTPWLFSDRHWGFFAETEAETRWDLSHYEEDRVSGSFSGQTDDGRFHPLHLWLGDPARLLQRLTHLQGAPALPPPWAFGPWMSANGWATQKEAEEQLQMTRDLDIPATVMVLEAWSDEETFYIWNGARYIPQRQAFKYEDFSFPADGPWPDPRAFTKTLDEAGLHLVLWQIPIIRPISDNQNQQLRLDEREAIAQGYCVQNPDGTPFRIPDKWFSGSLLLDFSNPQAASWWLEKRRYLCEALNVEGFKTDGGEFVYLPEARFANHKTGVSMRNLYPALYTQAYYDFLNQNCRQGVTFSRAGYSGSQYRPLHWAGDQLSQYSELRGQLTAGLSAGLSGILFWGFDIGGFAGELPDSDLYLRSAAMGCFSPVMQFHSEPRNGQYGDSRRRDWINDRSPWNMARVNAAPEIITAYRRLAKLRMKMLPYLYAEARHSVATGRPLMAHLIYDYPDCRQSLLCEDQYMLGQSLLVAPILEEATTSREVWLPKGQWFDFWSGRPVTGGETILVNSLLGEIPVFSKREELCYPELM